MRKIFIDCGTHLGMGFSRLSEQLNIDHTWEVFGFEANPVTFDYYVKNIQSGKIPTFANKNISLENKAVWIHTNGIKFSLRGISEEHWEKVYKNGNDKSNSFYRHSWEPIIANLGAEEFNLTKEEIIDIPWDGGSTATELKKKIVDSEERSGLYKWHDDIEVESIDLSQWIIDNFDKEDYIILKMDIEGAEYTVLPKLIEDGTASYINRSFIEWHDWFMGEYSGHTEKLKNQLYQMGVSVEGWY